MTGAWKTTEDKEKDQLISALYSALYLCQDLASAIGAYSKRLDQINFGARYRAIADVARAALEEKP
jgi:hypothetical protein